MGTIPYSLRTGFDSATRRTKPTTGLACSRPLSLLLWCLLWASPGAAQCFEYDQGTPVQSGLPEQSKPGLTEPTSKISPEDSAPIRSGPQKERQVTSWQRLPHNLLADQKAIWSKPARLNRGDGKFLLPLAVVVAGLVASDQHMARSLSDGPPGTGYAFSKRVSQFGSLATDMGVAGAFYGFGKWRRNPYAADTGILATQALLNTIVIVEFLKTASRRERPTMADGQVMLDNAQGRFEAGGRSFPSGHAAHAWALASVVAHRYPRRWSIVLPSYGLAGMVSVSRMTARKHFPSDIVVGAALGYFIGRHVAHRDTAMPAKSRRVQVSLLPSPAPQGGYAATLHLEF